MEWLNPASLEKKPNRVWTKIKRSVSVVAAPLVQRWRNSRPQVQIAASIFCISNSTPETIDLGPPVSTNDTGLRAWIIPSTNTLTVEKHIEGRNFSTSSQMTMSSLSGGEAKLLTIGNFNQGPGLVSLVAFDFSPTVFADSVRFTMETTITESTNVSGRSTVIDTNLTLALRATIPDHTSLLIDAGPPKPPATDHFWFIISMLPPDAKGQPLKR
ncbi:MAG TPA: hypothetical protein VH413_20325 [Verrucomicrobiae bacterium]|nr:hypothetical protein [Verrucomicrobiae bacterium]